MRAFSIDNDWQVSGPEWIKLDVYEVQAVMPPDTTEHDSRLMLQTMLADRFGLKFHREQKETSVFALVTAKDGPKLEEVPRPETVSTGMHLAEGAMHFEAIPGTTIRTVLPMLSRAAGRPVLDETGLTGYYKIKLEWTYDPQDRTDAGMLSALPKIGLKLEPRTAQFDVIVIDSVAKDPTPN